MQPLLPHWFLLGFSDNNKERIATILKDINPLITNNPVALRSLLTETLFTSIEKGTPIVERKIVSASTTTTPPRQEPSKAEEFIYQGDRSSGILFVLRYRDFPYFSPQAEQAFEKTLGAIQLQVEKVAVVNLDKEQNPNDWHRIMDFFKPVKIILLGVEPSSLKLPRIEHNAFMKGKKATVFYTFSFEEMFADVEKKRLFWYQFRDFLKE